MIALRQDVGVSTRTRVATDASRRTDRQLRELADEFREHRLARALRQADVAAASGISRNHYAAIESARVRTVQLRELNDIAAAIGLELAVRAFPGSTPIRDAGHARRLTGFLAALRPPMTGRIEVALPMQENRWERRSWDAMLFGHGERTAVELEMRLRDVQATRRRHDLKRRDDPTEHFLLLLADTRHNRRVIAEFVELFAELPRLRPSVVRAAFEAGRHPPSGLLLI
jgi:transcriptional regulator with XRE-family HTH domain